MVVTKRNILSLLTGSILLSILVNPVQGILDIPHQSCLFTITFLSVTIGFFSLLWSKPVTLRLTVIDFLFILLAIGGTYFYNPGSTLFGLGRFALILIYWSIRQTGELNSNILYVVILLSVIVLAVYGYLQYLKVLPSNHIYLDISGPYGNPTVYAGMLCLLMSVPVTVLSYFRKKKFSSHWYFLSISVCLFALPALYFTHCRSAWVAFLFSIGYTVYRRFSLSFQWVIYSLFFLVLLGFLLYLYKPDSAQGRILIWKVTVQMIKEKPVFGFGPDGFTAEYMNYQGDYLKMQGSTRDKQLADNNHYVYNEPLRWLVEYGLIGLLLYIAIVYVIFSYKAQRINSFAAKLMCITGLIWGLFSYPDQAYPVMVIMAIILAEMSNCQRTYTVDVFSHWYAYQRVTIFIIIAVQSFLLVHMYCHHRELFQIVQQANTHKPKETILKLSGLEIVMKNERIFWMYYCHTLDQSRQDAVLLKKISHWEHLYPNTHTYVLKGEAMQRIGRIKEAEEAFWIAHYMTPSRQTARYKLALLYQKQGFISEAVRLAYEILTEKVKVYGFETYKMHRELRRIFENQLNNYSLKK